MGPRTHAELEASLEAYFRKAVRERLAGYTMKMIPVDKGAPDRIVMLPGGRIRLVELKVSGGRVSPAQRYWHERVGELGVTVATLTDRAGVDQWVRECIPGDEDKAYSPREKRLKSSSASRGSRRG